MMTVRTFAEISSENGAVEIKVMRPPKESTEQFLHMKGKIDETLRNESLRGELKRYLSAKESDAFVLRLTPQK